ncbi:MAG: tetratricopeptide repeat protein [Verrucomicrobia bacterium]|jgi:Flp pilus assembly protein TadD|nr:tetratricopeptide repeat protein [Verrucomicrobiota bacterium]
MKGKPAKPVRAGSASRASTAPPTAKGERPGGIGGRRRWLFRLLAMFVIPLVLLGLTEAGLRVAGYGYDPRFFIPQTIGGEKFFVQNDDFSFRFFPPQIVRQPGALRMKAVKPPGSVRIFVLGESAAMGDPEPAFGPARYMEVLLKQRYPGVEFEVVNVAFTAINSHVVLPIARECAAHQGDFWVVYLGNNEMVGPFGALTVFGLQAPPQGLVRLSLALQRTRLGQLGVALSRRLQKPATPDASWGGMQMFLKNRLSPDSPQRQQVYRNFASNLAGVLDAGTCSGVNIILNTVAVNLRDSPPFASEIEAGLSDSGRARLQGLLEAALPLEREGAWERAAEQLEAACALAPAHAEAHYRLASCLDRLGRTDEARRHYHLACDTDTLAFRTDSQLNGVIRRAGERDGVQLLDAETALPRESGVDIPGRESFYEHVHFNFDGAYHLGRLWAGAVADRLPERVRAQSASDWPSREACERRLGLTDWNRKLVTEAMLRRLRQPPFSSQSNQADRIQALSGLEQRLLAGMTPKAHEEAKAAYEEAIAGAPEDHYVHEVYGNFLQYTGDLAGADRQWEKVSRLMPHDFLPWFQMGVIEARQGNHAGAQRNLLQALELRPSLIEGWSELGQSYGALPDWPKALDCFDRACRLRPQDPILWAYRARVLGGMGRGVEAIQSYRQALALNPGYADAHGALGDLLAQSGRFPEAAAEYEAALRLRPNDVTANFNLGVMLLRTGRMVEGQQRLQRVLELDPNHALAQDYLRRLEAGPPVKP